MYNKLNASSPELACNFISINIDIDGSRKPKRKKNKIGKIQLLEFGNFLTKRLAIISNKKITISKYPK
ncbi:hypothetical protein EYD46_07225 [Hyunsoonleella pacifica]|uniref:Uncharacterized protein n=1 Tax=Hyunsoonleella pacifica TaxID=1080224 RepID=A0A4Q9FRT9_9FLAO|nr:hypothetical protein EYD46_07225 [Hyunsoonleella pacifica]GGD19521.1 hypothetical protein GCM10011368_21800 [Hyunsoonleella pacifica]